MVGGRSIKHINRISRCCLRLGEGGGDKGETFLFSELIVNSESSRDGPILVKQKLLMCGVWCGGGVLGGKNTVEISKRNIYI